jgi:hypothetical protein
MPVVYEGHALIHVAPVKSSDIAEAAVGDLVTQLEETPLFDEHEII